MRKKGVQFLIYIVLSFTSVGVAYFLGKIGGNHFITGDSFPDFLKNLTLLLLTVTVIIFILGHIYFLYEEKIKILTKELRRIYTKKNIVIFGIVIVSVLGSTYFIQDKVKENAVYEQSVLEFDRTLENLETADNMITQAYEEKDEEALVYRIKWFDEAIEKFRVEDLAVAKRIGKESEYNLELQKYSRLLIQHKMNFEKLTGNKYQEPV